MLEIARCLHMQHIGALMEEGSESDAERAACDKRAAQAALSAVERDERTEMIFLIDFWKCD